MGLYFIHVGCVWGDGGSGGEWVMGLHFMYVVCVWGVVDGVGNGVNV